VNGLTLDETVAMVTDACQVGWVDPETAVAILRDVLRMSSALCLHLLVEEICDRRGTPPPDYSEWPL
jgi:hypothetical protein